MKTSFLFLSLIVLCYTPQLFSQSTAAEAFEAEANIDQITNKIDTNYDQTSQALESSTEPQAPILKQYIQNVMLTHQFKPTTSMSTLNNYLSIFQYVSNSLNNNSTPSEIIKSLNLSPAQLNEYPISGDNLSSVAQTANKLPYPNDQPPEPSLQTYIPRRPHGF